ncbi:MAG: hypothetical protein FJ109_08830 [Deltaproteobacteria bacterium]|nr:hypothetical protein [Deltaproteobacteria bacterium]
MPEKGSSSCPRPARIALANWFLSLAWVLLIVIGPAAWKYYLRFSTNGIVFHEVTLAVLVVGVALSLFEGVRGLRQRRYGALAAVTLAVFWLLYCLGFVYWRSVGVQ